MTETSKTTYRKDYRPFTHAIDSVDLNFQLDPDSTLVTSTLTVSPVSGMEHDLVLDGDSLSFESLQIDGELAGSDRYSVTEKALTVFNIDKPTKLTITNRFSPAKNTALSGIYMTKTGFMSQCEAQGFRRITYYPDRPDVMSKFTVTIHADKELYPVLLSNGNLVGEGDEEGGRHFARWQDPFKKPCYLFALVAGKLKARSEKMKLANGNEVLLQVWTDEANYPKSAWALTSLKKAISWDEKRWGLELDLTRFMIVATDDFNFGAMENKGLNIFNSRYVMASPLVATDTDYSNILTVVGHEYFHNWTGDRVTLRDWFQLTQKEGLTTFREQEFGMDMAADAASRSIRRIEEVRALRSTQFPEDAGPMAHPIRPDSYQEINNFYTMTVYEKGAEVVRMLQTIFGEEGFKKGFDHYISHFDGQAVTCENFIESMEQANHADLSDFMRWYSQAGTPRVTVDTAYDNHNGTYTVTLSQSTPPTSGAAEKKPFVIPVVIGLLDRKTGRDLPLHLTEDKIKDDLTSRLLLLNDKSQSWTFRGLQSEPVISIGRGFSAPVIFEYDYSNNDLAFLALNDSDPFNRAEAMNRLSLVMLGEIVTQIESGQPAEILPLWFSVFNALLRDISIPAAYRATILTLPSEGAIGQTRPLINPDAIHRAVEFVKEEVGRRLSSTLAKVVEENLPDAGPYSPEAPASGKRALKNLSLSYWLCGGSAKALLTAREQFRLADNLTDKLAAMQMIIDSRSPAKVDVLNDAAMAWKDEPLLMNKWFTVQATANCQEDEMPVVERVRKLMTFKVFNIANPNNVYALINAFCTRNPAEFHRLDGSGYAFWRDAVLQLDKVNPSTASRVARALDNWRRYTPDRAKMMFKTLNEVANNKTLSRGVREIVVKAISNNK